MNSPTVLSTSSTMAAVSTAVDSAANDFQELTVNERKVPVVDKTVQLREPDDAYDERGLGLSGLYRLAVQFFREKEGKAVNFSYQDKLKLIAYTQQASRGKFSEDKLPPLGVLDVPGRHRRLAWQALGDMSQEEAMKKFIDMLNDLCPLFEAFVEAHKRDAEERNRLAHEQKERERKEEEMRLLAAEEERRKEEEALQQEAQRRRIQEALNQQTFTQFKSYAEQQFPGNPEQQAVLIRQLQEQHYHQYMQQLLHQQTIGAAHSNTSSEDYSVPSLESVHHFISNGRTTSHNSAAITNGNIEDGRISNADCDEEITDFPEIPLATMWTRKDTKEFKDSIKKEASEAVIKVGHGETVTVRVPTHEKGSCLVWEFATDNYDIGFGVFFEWTKPTSSAVTVHISESEDEDEEDDDDEEIVFRELSDIEAGQDKTTVQSAVNRPLVSVIIPVYRRDCQDEVYAGSHQYPGEGVYLLKFDNSYSLWRSKTLYYRVCYTQ